MHKKKTLRTQKGEQLSDQLYCAHTINQKLAAIGVRISFTSSLSSRVFGLKTMVKFAVKKLLGASTLS